MDSSPTEIDWPPVVQSLFWEYDTTDLDWEADRDLIFRRILTEGSWDAVQWLRGRVGDAALRHWIEARAGATLSPRQLRFWELILDLPSDRVDEWVAVRCDSVWENRTAR